MQAYRLPTFTLLAAAAAIVAGCASAPANNAALDDARSDYRVAQANAQSRDLAPAEMQQAGDALAKADAAFAKREDTATVNQLAYLAKQRVALARQAADRKAAELSVADAGLARDKLRLDARTAEADAAKMNAERAQRQAEAAQRDAMASQRQSSASQVQAADAERRARALEAELNELNAKKTDRGMVITIGDVLFDTGRAELKSGGVRNVEKLAGFLKQYPQRKALIEGFTDSTGSSDLNVELSSRRADAVRDAIAGMGVGSDRLATKGYGAAFPVAANNSAGGRQLNRRVEILLSDDGGNITPR